MKTSTKFTDAIHTLVLIYMSQEHEAIDVSSQGFAKSIDTNPAFIRQIMGPLKKAGIIISVPGHAMPELAMQPEDISLSRIYEALEGQKPILRIGTHPNPNCGIGVNIQYAVQDYYDALNDEVIKRLGTLTLKDVIDRSNEKIAERGPAGPAR